MDGQTFDDLVKRLATIRLTRLVALRGLVTSAAMALTGATLTAEETEAKKKTKAAGKKGGHKKATGGSKKKHGHARKRRVAAQGPPQKHCKFQGYTCKTNADCCTLNCCNRICCGDGQSCVNGQCTAGAPPPPTTTTTAAPVCTNNCPAICTNNCPANGTGFTECGQTTVGNNTCVCSTDVCGTRVCAAQGACSGAAPCNTNADCIGPITGAFGDVGPGFCHTGSCPAEGYRGRCVPYCL
jgi:hypothetical protein